MAIFSFHLYYLIKHIILVISIITILFLLELVYSKFINLLIINFLMALAVTNLSTFTLKNYTIYMLINIAYLKIKFSEMKVLSTIITDIAYQKCFYLNLFFFSYYISFRLKCKENFEYLRKFLNCGFILQLSALNIILIL